ncbi:hypothetical protein NDU88_000440 [Pleurodeles waltl]|uniref:Uncharacterized protein n=1 Tax=Pleurodeles waltl TaxID=8319 RepID=A0AAV7UT38_PLEWA|nr:hypothetical protein NDU88_000440 [Pleurodeles waltl]
MEAVQRSQARVGQVQVAEQEGGGRGGRVTPRLPPGKGTLGRSIGSGEAARALLIHGDIDKVMRSLGSTGVNRSRS